MIRNIIFIMVLLISFSNAFAFDLEDYATTYRATRDEYDKASLTLAEKEAAYKKAFSDRLAMEKLVRIAEQQKAIDDGDADAQKTAEDEIKKLEDLKKASASCGI